MKSEITKCPYEHNRVFTEEESQKLIGVMRHISINIEKLPSLPNQRCVWIPIKKKEDRDAKTR